MKPDPTPVSGTENGLTELAVEELVIVTTAGLTCAATVSIAFDAADPLRVVCEVVDAAFATGTADPVAAGVVVSTTAAVPPDASAAESRLAAATSPTQRQARGVRRDVAGSGARSIAGSRGYDG